MPATDADVLIPQPRLWRIAGEELRQVPLSIRKLMGVVRFVEQNTKLLEKFTLLGKPKEEGGLALSDLLQDEVYVKANELVRLLLPAHAALLTDEWCLDHLSNADYVAFVKTAIEQNQLTEVFTRAKSFVTVFLDERLRQTARLATMTSAQS